MRKLDAIEHGFTHFRLTIHPVLCDVSRPASRMEAPGRLWLELAQAGEAATPAPVKKLLHTFTWRSA
jgi:A/G-specific adenine glycosylase